MGELRALPALTVSLLLLLAGCGSGVVSAEPPGDPYGGPLFVEVTHPHRATDPVGRYGAAADVVRCDDRMTGGFSGDGYDDGATGDDAEQALRIYLKEQAWDWPRGGYRLEREEKTRALFTYAVEGEPKLAVVVHEGPVTGDDGWGWHVESWARCDLAEFEPAFAESLGVQVWSDAQGERVPVRLVQSYAGSAHCDEQEMTFLQMRKTFYVRDPSGELDDLTEGRFGDGLPLPAGAVDTGYHRDDRHLWLSADGDAAFVGSRESVEKWPRAGDGFGCA